MALYLKISSFECMLLVSHLLSTMVHQFTRPLTPWMATACDVSMATGIREWILLALFIYNSRDSSPSEFLLFPHDGVLYVS